MNDQRGPLAFFPISVSKARVRSQNARTSRSRAGKSTVLGTGSYTGRRSSGPLAPRAAEAGAGTGRDNTRPRVGAMVNAIRAGNRASTTLLGCQAPRRFESPGCVYVEERA